MANNCFYTIQAVSKNKKNLERLLDIMRYKDKEFFVYRCFSAGEFDWNENGDLFSVSISGDVAWSCKLWFNHEEDKECKDVIGYEKNEKGEEDWNKPIYGTSHRVSLDILCKYLDIGLECYSEEPGMCFQEHYVVDHEGKIVTNECADWSGIYEEDLPDENNKEEVGDFLEEHGLDSLDDIDWGFEDYCNFGDIEEIYKGYC